MSRDLAGSGVPRWHLNFLCRPSNWGTLGLVGDAAGERVSAWDDAHRFSGRDAGCAPRRR
jgi:hypothetical protein